MRGHTKFNNCFIKCASVIVGPEENKGPLSSYFDGHIEDYYASCNSFEKCEAKLLRESVKTTLLKGGLTDTDVDVCISGDLMNQLASSHYTLRYFDIPFLGIYSACATYVQGLINACYLLESDYKNILVSTASHNLSSERQFRNPNEYGGAKNITSTFTVTAGASMIVSSDVSMLKFSESTIGRVVDFDYHNQFDMGSLMAPSALDTIIRHFDHFNTKPSDYDLILTGDLSNIGYEIVLEGLENKYGKLTNYNDAGKLIFEEDKKVFCGGSGPGCMASVFSGYIKKLMEMGLYKKVLLCATGALINVNMCLQNDSIPSISHVIVVERV